MTNFESFIAITKALKESSQSHQSFHAAFLVKGGKIFSIGINSMKGNAISSTYVSRKEDRLSYTYTAGIHAEMACLSKVKHKKYNMNEFSMIVIRVNNNGEVSNSRPCHNCCWHLGRYNLKKIYHSNAEGEIEKMKI